MGLFLGEYENLKLLGRGAFATIHKVRHAQLGYVRALKVLWVSPCSIVSLVRKIVVNY